MILLGIKNITNIPYTPMLLTLGLAIGAAGDYLWAFGDSMQYVIKLSAHTLLMVFIPPLIFESSFSLDTTIFITSFWQIIILAFPAVALTAFFIAIVLRFFLAYKD